MKDIQETKVVKIVKNRKMKKSPNKKGSSDQKQSNHANRDSNKTESHIKEDVSEDVSAHTIAKEVVVQPRRDFSTDLMGYISSWNYRETSGQWKFNKILQTWALDHCFDKERIDGALFKSLMPYLMSIKGNAADRLLVRAEEIITQSCENDEEDEEIIDVEGGGTKEGKNEESISVEKNSLSLKRAIKIKFEFSKLTKLLVK